jgi:hypothetical protein
MSTSVRLSELIEYTDWERGKWHGWLRQQGNAVLATSAGPHGDGRFETVGGRAVASSSAHIAGWFLVPSTREINTFSQELWT